MVYLLVIILPFSLFLLPSIQGKTLFWGVSSLQFIPWRGLAMDSLLHGQIPFINPYNGLGSPLLANYQLALFYPFNWLQLPIYAAWGNPGLAASYNLLIPLHLSLSAAGMILFLKKLKFSPLASGFGALAFSLCSYLIARTSFFSIVLTLTWLPWLMFTFTGLVAALMQNPLYFKQIWWKFLAFIGIFSLLLLAGHAQTAWYSILITAGWGVAFGYYLKKWFGVLKSIGAFFAGGIIAAMITAIQLIPTWEYLQQSQRAGSVAFDYAMTYSFWPWRLITFFLPDFFGNPGMGTFWGYGNYWEDACFIGLIPVVLAVYAIFRRNRIADKPLHIIALTYFGIAAAISILLAFGKNTPIFGFLFNYIPTFNMFQAPARWVILVCFSLTVLASIGFEILIGPSKRKQKSIILFIVLAAGVIVAGCASLVLHPGIPRTMPISLIRAGVIGVCTLFIILFIPKFASSERMHYWVAGILLITALDLLTIASPLIPFTDLKLYRSEVKTEDSSLLEPRLYIQPDDEYDLKFTRFFRTHDFRPIENWENLRAVNLPNSNILSNTAYVNNFDPMVPASYQALIKQLESTDNAILLQWLRHLNANSIEQIDIETPLGIKMQGVADSRFLNAFQCNESNGVLIVRGKVDPEHPIVIDPSTNQVVADNCRTLTEISTELHSSGSSSIEIDLSSSKPVWIEMAMIWYPGWKATLDEISIDIYKVNGILIGLQVPVGDHHLVLKYDPESYKIGLTISAATIFLLFIFTAIVILRQRKKVQHAKE
jgi:hypothetical protein